MSILLITAAFALFAQRSVVGTTECYSCVNSTAVYKCSSVVSCKIGEICFADHKTTIGGLSITLECMPEASCSSIVTGNNSIGGSLIGRSTSAGVCSECCRQNRCNRQLCQRSLQQQQNPCSDGGSLNCASVAEFLDVCLDHVNALQTCRRFCGLCSYVDGSWSLWLEWSYCDVSCGNGTQSRIRKCTEPSPAGGGKDCSGTSNQTQICSAAPCPAQWSSWSSWGSCSATCGVWLQRRDRSCSNPYPSLNEDHCFGDSRDYKMCLESECAETKGGWNVWSVWTNCSATCNTGLKTRQRQCNNPVPSSGGQYCEGSPIDVILCNKHHFQANGGWSIWSVWTDCSATCNTGVQTRQRQCNNPVPSSGGQYCEGSQMDVMLCNKHQCSGTDGGWSVWSVWTACSATCNTGLKTRQRQCSNPRPSSGGQDCDGSPTEVILCNQQHCPQANGGWGLWSVWTDCSATCNTGLQTRKRQCNNPVPSSGGQYCEGSQMDVILCNKHHCSGTDGGWSVWSVWTACSATCNTGLKTRQRQCSNPRPSSGGRDCDGSSTEVILCNQQHCPRAKASFTAILATRLSSGILSFSGVLLNEGSNFDGDSGTFTCQHSGLYFFTVFVNENGGGIISKINCVIRLNDSNVVQLMYEHSQGLGGVTGSATLHLKNADRVNVWCSSDTSKVGRLSFTGYLIAEDP